MSNDPTKGDLVEFVQDVSPYCKGDVVRLDAEAKKYVAARCKAVGIETSPYKASKGTSRDEVNVETVQPVVASAAPAVEVSVEANNPAVEGSTVTNVQVTPDNGKNAKK